MVNHFSPIIDVLDNMLLSKLDSFEIPATFDAHVHLRDGEMMELVIKAIRAGGASMVYVRQIKSSFHTIDIKNMD